MNFITPKVERKLKLHTKKNKKEVLSVNHIHSNKVEYFENLQLSVLPKKIKELEKIKLKKNIKNNYNKIQILTDEIFHIKEKTEEIDYYLNTAKILDKYFSTDDTDKTDVIIDYFTAINMPVPDKYYRHIAFTTESLYCSNCKSNSFIELEVISCTVCGMVKDNIISSKPSYKEMQERPQLQCDLAYKRIDYFKQWLNQIQGNEHVVIPQNIIDDVILQIRIERVKNIANISNNLVKKLLKKTGNSKYYEHIPSIIRDITKTKPLIIPSGIEEKLINMFYEVDKIWVHVKPDNRKSFFSYPYIIHKFCQLLGLTEYLHNFPLLKNRIKVFNQEMIWKKVIEYFKTHRITNDFIRDVQWVFIPSV